MNNNGRGIIETNFSHKKKETTRKKECLSTLQTEGRWVLIFESELNVPAAVS